MAVKAVLPSSNLTWDDIRDTLNANGGAVTNDIRTAFLDTAKINIWSFYKPHHAIINFPSSVPNAVDARGGLYLDTVNKEIKWYKPTGGAESPYRLSDFCGYEKDAKGPTVDDKKSSTLIKLPSSSFNINIYPYWGDPKFDWGLILGGFNFNECQIKVEIYNQRKVKLGTAKFKIGDSISGGLTTTAYIGSSSFDKNDTHLYLKGFFCDYDGNELALIPSSDDGFIEKPISFSQDAYIYSGTISIDDSRFTVGSSMADGEGTYTSNIRITMYNEKGPDYVATTGRPYARYRWRSADGTYVGTFIGGITLEDCKNIPTGFTRSSTIDCGAYPTAQVEGKKWFLDIEVVA